MLAYLEIKDFPSDITPILKGATEVLSWYRSGKLAENERDASLVVLNAVAYAGGLGADYFAHVTVAATGDGEAVASHLETAVASAQPSEDGSVKAVSPFLIFQIASFVFQLIKSLKS